MTELHALAPSISEGATLLQAHGLCKFYGAREVLHEVNIAIRPREIVTIVGPNGAGKTTLLNCLLGLDSTEYGTVSRAAGLRIGYVPQQFAPPASLPMDVGSFLKLYAKGEAGEAFPLLGGRLDGGRLNQTRALEHTSPDPHLTST